MQTLINEGVWPTMITPFKKDRSIDYYALEKLIDWYIENKVAGLFAVCQSSEMFYLTREERNELARYVVKYVNNRCPVIASGHVSDVIDDQVRDIVEIAETGVEAVVLVSNRLKKQNEPDEKWYVNLERLLSKLPEEIKLGMYECPHPYKHLLSSDMLRFLSSSGRFHFLKDTSSDLAIINRRAEILKEGRMRAYNANSATLLDSLKAGYSGFSGIMANYHPALYNWLWKNRRTESSKVKDLQDFLGISSMIEMYGYPLNAKYFLKSQNIPIELVTRINDVKNVESSTQELVKQIERQTLFWRKECGL